MGNGSSTGEGKKYEGSSTGSTQPLEAEAPTTEVESFPIVLLDSSAHGSLPSPKPSAEGGAPAESLPVSPTSSELTGLMNSGVLAARLSPEAFSGNNRRYATGL